MKSISNFFATLLLCAALSIAACGQTEKSPADKNEVKTNINAEKDEQISAKIGEDILTLLNNEGKCQLLFKEQKINLDLPWQCDFHRLQEGTVRVFPKDFYEAKNRRTPKEYRNMQIILIEHSKPDSVTPNECRTELQAIKIVKGKLTKSTKMGNLSMCPPFQWDAKNFTALFE